MNLKTQYYVSATITILLWAFATADTQLDEFQPKALVFKANFSKPTISQAFGGARISYGEQNVILWASGGGIEVHYPAGSYSPEGPIIGGFGVWTDHPVPGDTASFKYSVFFPAGFNFVKGGKLPGLYGGRKQCAGGDPAVDCFSTRVMWRESGKGELYLYANREAQDPAICQMPNNYCAPYYGWSLNTGAFTFKTGEWTDIQEVIRMNTPGQRNGLLSIRVNGKEVIRYDNIVFRIADYPNMRIEGMDVDTFFGGTGTEWATPTHQLTKFREFILETV
ncbi:unnamed protein product [Orchesella dallaii]|uniref:Polysaccharide lyase 14 domain-containing protein n=1 Tax=Orchesella dallaii TaxID=48710 RepID=A0ABP1PTZ4_9HEXA